MKTNWTRCSNLTDQYATRICHKKQLMNRKIKDLNQAILKAATETIPHGTGSNYRPCRTEELQQLEDETDEAREKAENNNPTVEINIAMKKATSKHRKVFVHEARRCWPEQTEQLNLDEDGTKLWRLTRAMNGKSSTSSPLLSSKQNIY